MSKRYAPSTGEALTLNGLVELAHEYSVAAGWWDECLPYAEVETPDPEGGRPYVHSEPDRSAAPRITPETASSKCMLVVTEIAEAVECVRDGQIYAFRDAATDKPEGLPFELADAIIRIADLAGAYGIDLDAAVREKMAYNRTRPFRHGGKAL